MIATEIQKKKKSPSVNRNLGKKGPSVNPFWTAMAADDLDLTGITLGGIAFSRALLQLHLILQN